MSAGTTACAFCGSREARELFPAEAISAGSYRILSCERCRVARTDPVPPPEVSERLYATATYRRSDGSRFLAPVEQGVSWFTRRKAQRLSQLQKTGAVLDIGCGRGALLAEMRRRGWATLGVELNEETASYANRVHGLDTLAVRDLGTVAPERFDLVTLYHVLEHAERPEVLLASALRVLKRDGTLVVAVPNLDSLQALFGKGRWFHLDVPHHLHHFTGDGLVRILRQAGLEVRSISHFDPEQNPFGWLQTLLNVLGVRLNLLYNVLRGQRTGGGSGKAAGMAATLLLLPVLAPLGLVLAFVEAYPFRRGGTIEVVAVKTSGGKGP